MGEKKKMVSLIKLWGREKGKNVVVSIKIGGKMQENKKGKIMPEKGL